MDSFSIFREKNVYYNFNPLLPNTNNFRIVNISLLRKEGTMEKLCYERHVYESVDSKSIS